MRYQRVEKYAILKKQRTTGVAIPRYYDGDPHAVLCPAQNDIKCGTPPKHIDPCEALQFHQRIIVRLRQFSDCHILYPLKCFLTTAYIKLLKSGKELVIPFSMMLRSLRANSFSNVLKETILHDVPATIIFPDS